MYKKTKEQLSDIREKFSSAGQQLEALELKKEELQEAFEQSYEVLTSERAALEIGNGTKEAVKEAKKHNSSLKDQMTECREDISVKRKVVSLLEKQLSDLQSIFRGKASEHWQKQLEPTFDKIVESMNEIDRSLDVLNETRKEIQQDGLQPDSFMNGITHDSQPMLNKRRVNGMDVRNFITTEKLQS